MRSLIVVVAAAGTARADDPASLHATTEAEPASSALVPVPLPPPALRVSIDTIDLDTLGVDHRYVLDRSTALELHGDWLDSDTATHTWNASARLSRKIGGLDVALDLGAGHVISDLAEGAVPGRVRSDVREGSYTWVGVSVTKNFALSRNVTGFVSLTAGFRHWLNNQAPPAEGDAAQLMLWIGLHF